MSGVLGTLASVLQSKGLLVGLGVLVASGGFVVGSQYAFSVDAPEWEVGDTWQYEGSYTMDVSYTDPESGESFTESDSDSGEIWMTVVDDSQTIGDIPVYAVAISEDGDDWDEAGLLSKANLNPLIPEFEFSCPAMEHEFDADDYGDYDHYAAYEQCEASEVGIQELMVFDFPLYPGKSWTVSPDEFLDFANFTARVGDRDVIDTPAGQLVAYRIDLSLQEVRDPQMERYLEEADLDWGFSYWYSPEIEWIARVNMWAEGQDPEGYGEGRFEFTLDVVEHTHRDLASQSVDEDVPVSGINGERIHIEIDEPVVNAAEAPEVTMTAHGDNMPDGVDYVWHFGDEESEGEEVAFVVDEPGIHKVKVTAVRDGEVVARATAKVIGNFDGTFDGAYVPGWTPGAGNVFSFQVADGISRLHVAYEPRNVGGVAHDPGDDMTLLDAEGEVVSNEPFVEMHDIDGRSGTWTVEITTDATEVAVGDYSIHVVQDYTFAPNPAEVRAEHRIDDWGFLFPSTSFGASHGPDAEAFLAAIGGQPLHG